MLTMTHIAYVLCVMLDVSRSSVYYQSKKQEDSTLDSQGEKKWKDSKKNVWNLQYQA
ncbi:hypothetical protein AwErysi_09720 [Erysipelotrichaceae bacterium]|nr:hypothetical protein AwErysi_09720 [Erysipelotrichaceae bacterium]